MKTETLFVDCILGDQLEEWCDKPPTDVGNVLGGDADSYTRGEVLFDEEVIFENGTRMAIQAICSENPTSEPIWTQGVLFGEEGTELGCTDVCGSFYGKFQVDEYVCIVKPFEQLNGEEEHLVGFGLEPKEVKEEPKKKKKRRKVKKMKASWDFELDNIINIPAIEGVDPENMTDEQWKQCHELLLEKLKVLFQENDVTFKFEKVFVPEE